ncbi:MAG: UbiA family prenyltransferase [Nocardioides sp.]
MPRTRGDRERVRMTMDVRRGVAGLLGSAHPGPSAAVTLLAAAYGASVGLSAGRLTLVTSAVLAGQLSIGWSNDLIDRRRDAAVARTDKPLARGDVSVATVRAACAVAVVGTVVLSLACGPVAGAVHLACVAAGWAYNLGVKSTLWSWLPFAVAFGGLPVFVTLAVPGAGLPSPSIPIAGALLGVGAHLVNVLPDLAEDAVTGVRGLPHRLGERWTPVLAVLTLVTATGVLTLGLAAGGTSLPVWLLVSVPVLVVALAAVALGGRGRVPFRAAVGIAAVDVLLLVVAT